MRVSMIMCLLCSSSFSAGWSEYFSPVNHIIMCTLHDISHFSPHVVFNLTSSCADLHKTRFETIMYTENREKGLKNCQLFHRRREDSLSSKVKRLESCQQKIYIHFEPIVVFLRLRRELFSLIINKQIFISALELEIYVRRDLKVLCLSVKKRVVKDVWEHIKRKTHKKWEWKAAKEAIWCAFQAEAAGEGEGDDEKINNDDDEVAKTGWDSRRVDIWCSSMVIISPLFGVCMRVQPNSSSIREEAQKHEKKTRSSETKNEKASKTFKEVL